MKAKEFIVKKRDPNWQTLQAKRTSGAAGAHKNKKKAAKQGDVKHKAKSMAEDYNLGGLEKDKYYLHSIYSDSKIFTDPQSGDPMSFDSYDEAEDFRSGMSGREHDEYQVSVFNQGQLLPVDEGVSEGINPDELYGYVYDTKNRYLGQWNGQRLVIDPAVWQKWKDDNGQDWASGMVGMAKDRIAAGVWKVQQEKQGVAEYGDTAKGQKMLTKVQKRAVDRVVSKKAETDPKYAKKNADTANRAWDRMTDKDESIELERVRDPEDWDEGDTEPPNNFAIYINGKKWKVFQGRGRYADDEREMKQFYDLKAWCQRKSDATGKKWEVARTGEPPTA